MANVVLKWLGNKLFNGTKMIFSIKGNNVKVDKTNLGDLIDVNTEELEEDVERALLGNHVYSTTERVCGKWIDGRNIYENVVVLSEPITIVKNTWNEATYIPSNADIVLECRVVKSGYGMACLDFFIDNGTPKVRTTDDYNNVDTFIVQYLKNEGE